MNTNFTQLPKDLPVPVDAAASHLLGTVWPEIALPSTDGSAVNPRQLGGRWVIYIYPMTGAPGVALPDGWDAIPAREVARRRPVISATIIQNFKLWTLAYSA